MCLISHFKCVCCGRGINALDLVFSRNQKEYSTKDWDEGMKYECPHCKEKFICSKVEIVPTVYDEKLGRYKCSCAVPTFVKK